MICLLLKAIQEKLADGLETLPLVHQSESGNKAGPPHIWVGDLPAKRNPKDYSNLPCVLLTPLGGHHSEEGAAADVALICVVFNPEDGDGSGGENDLANLISKITGLLIEALDSKGCPLDGRFVLEPDRQGRILPWQKSDQQPKPFIQATMTSTWRYKGWE